MKKYFWTAGSRNTIETITLGVAVALLSSCGSQTSTSADPEATPTPQSTVTITTTTTTTPAPTVASLIPSLSPLTQANLDKLSKDMSPSQVTSILGQPTSSDTKPIPIVGGTETTYQYDDGKSSITIVFKNNLLQTKSGTFGPAQ